MFCSVVRHISRTIPLGPGQIAGKHSAHSGEVGVAKTNVLSFSLFLVLRPLKRNSVLNGLLKNRSRCGIVLCGGFCCVLCCVLSSRRSARFVLWFCCKGSFASLGIVLWTVLAWFQFRHMQLFCFMFCFAMREMHHCVFAWFWFWCARVMFWHFFVWCVLRY